RKASDRRSTLVRQVKPFTLSGATSIEKSRASSDGLGLKPLRLHERLSHPVISADGAHGPVSARADPDVLDECFGRPRTAGPADTAARSGNGKVGLAQQPGH